MLRPTLFRPLSTGACSPAHTLAAVSTSSSAAAASSPSTSAAFTSRIHSASSSFYTSSASSSSSSSAALFAPRRSLHTTVCRLAPGRFKSGAPYHPPKGPRSLPTRTARHDAEWDKVRSHRDPLITTVDPAAPLPELGANDLELDRLSFRYGLAPLPSLHQRLKAYSVEQSYYDRRDARIRDHLDRLLRMKTLSKKEMLILIDQVETSKWNLAEMQKAYVPETRHAEQDEEDAHAKTLQLGTGGVKNKADYKKKKEDKKAAKADGKITPPKGDGEPKYGYRRDLANLGPESWDYLSPYVILEPEARHLSYLDGAYKYEDRYVLWDVEQRNLALGAKLQRMKQLGIPLEQAESMPTPDTVPNDHLFPTARIRRSMRKAQARGDKIDGAFWKQFEQRPNRAAANERLLNRKEAKTMTEARRNIPDYIKRFEKEQNAVEINVGATTVLAQNLYLQSRIDAEKKKPSLLTKDQQQSAKNLMAVFAQRNRLAMRKMFLGTRNMWERLMIERALERKYLEVYTTVGSDFVNSKYLLKMEQEMMATVAEIAERFQEVDLEQSALKLRDFRQAQDIDAANYSEEYVKKMEELMHKHKELPTQENVGSRNWTREIVDWEQDPEQHQLAKDEAKKLLTERQELDAELDTWNEWYDVQVAQELGSMVDSGEVKDVESVAAGAIAMAEKRVAMRLHATRQEWKEWRYRPQYTEEENMLATPDVTRVDEEASTLGGKSKSPGAQIVAQILAKDPLMAASQRWKARMAPLVNEVNRIEGNATAGTIMQHVDAEGNYVAPVTAASGSGAPLVDSAFGPGSVLPDFDTTLSTAGHQVMDGLSVEQRRAMVAHGVTNPGAIHDSLRRESEDPLLELLHEHSRKNRRGGVAASGGGGGDGEGGQVGSGNPHEFSTVDPKLGFEDDDFRLYDPVLTKGADKAKRDEAEAEPSLINAQAEQHNKLKRDGEGILNDLEQDPVQWNKRLDRLYRREHFLDLDPFGPANTDERRDFDDQYFHLDEEDYAYKKRVDPETDHQKPLTQLTRVEPYDQQPDIIRFDLSDDTAHVMYMMHRSDPVKFTPRFLAHKFQLSAARVKSALMMQAIHYRMVENGVIHPLMMQHTEESAMDELLVPSMPMIHDPPKFGRAPLPDYRWVREDDMHRVLAEEKEIEDRFLSRSARLDKAESEYYAKYGPIGTTPPQPSPPEILDKRLMPPTRHSIMMIDTSEMPASRFTMALREERGALREPNEEEYHFIRKQEKGPFNFTYVKYHKEDNPM